MTLVLVGCDAAPSQLDTLVDRRAVPEEYRAWVEIERRSRPLGVRNELLVAATRGPRTTPADRQARIAELLRWMDAGGSVPSSSLFAALNETTPDGLLSLVREAVRADPANDRLIELALYAAARQRADGEGVLAGVLAHALVALAIEARPTAPQVAAKHAPSDAEVIRLFASEAVFARRAALEVGDPEDVRHDLAMWRELFASDPRARASFHAAMDAAAARYPHASTTSFVRAQAAQLFANVDAYQRWLAP